MACHYRFEFVFSHVRFFLFLFLFFSFSLFFFFRDGKKIQNISNFCMLKPHDLDRLFELFTKIQHYSYEARRRSAKTKLQRKKLDKMQSSADAFNTIPVDAVHLYLTEPKTCFTEFFWRLIVTGTGVQMPDDLIEEKEQQMERERLMEQVRTGVFTVEGEGIDSQEITFGGFCQAVCRFCMFDIRVGMFYQRVDVFSMRLLLIWALAHMGQAHMGPSP